MNTNIFAHPGKQKSKSISASPTRPENQEILSARNVRKVKNIEPKKSNTVKNAQVKKDTFFLGGFYSEVST